MAPPRDKFDDRLVNLHTAIENEISQAQEEHRRLCEEELSLFTNFIHHEGFGHVSSYQELVHRFRDTRPLIERAIQDFARKREERRNHHDRYTNELKQHMRKVQLYILPEALRTGKRQLLFDAAAKMESTMRLGSIRAGSDRGVAMSVLFRYPELSQQHVVAGLRHPNDPPPTIADKRRFASYLLIAEQERVRCPAHTHLRQHFEMLFQWTWGLSIEDMSNMTDDDYITSFTLCKSEPSPLHDEVADTDSGSAIQGTSSIVRARRYTLAESSGPREVQKQGSRRQSEEHFVCPEAELSNEVSRSAARNDTYRVVNGQGSYRVSARPSAANNTGEQTQPNFRADSKMNALEHGPALQKGASQMVEVPDKVYESDRPLKTKRRMSVGLPFFKREKHGKENNHKGNTWI